MRQCWYRYIHINSSHIVLYAATSSVSRAAFNLIFWVSPYRLTYSPSLSCVCTAHHSIDFTNLPTRNITLSIINVRLLFGHFAGNIHTGKRLRKRGKILTGMFTLVCIVAFWFGNTISMRFISFKINVHEWRPIERNLLAACYYFRPFAQY